MKDDTVGHQFQSNCVKGIALKHKFYFCEAFLIVGSVDGP